MTANARVALNRLLAAFETHFDAVTSRRGEDDPAVEVAYARLSEAFDAYEIVLFDDLHETTPLVIFDDEDYDDLEDFDEDDDDDLDDDDDDLDGEDDDLGGEDEDEYEEVDLDDDEDEDDTDSAKG